MKLKGKVAVVTGAAAGIGREVAVLFAREGAKVVLADVNDEQGRQVQQLIVESQEQASFVHTDISRAVQVQRMASNAISTFGRLDILVNNAGVVEAEPIEDLSEGAWERVIDVNLKGTWLGAKYCVPWMRKQGRGVIVNISSEFGLVGFPSYSAYCASKGGVIALTRALAAELAPQIRVNCICPGVVVTPMLEFVLKSSLHGDLKGNETELAKRYPLRRLGEVSDVASAALYLASDEASWVTGIALPVDGGRTAV